MELFSSIMYFTITLLVMVLGVCTMITFAIIGFVNSLPKMKKEFNRLQKQFNN